MTAKDLAVVVRGIGPVVREYVALALTPIGARLAALEVKDGIPGRDGKDGAPGQKGLDGAPGERGPEGPKGDAGPVGSQGQRGEKGDPGAAGERGPEGPEGKPGRDGRDGLPGLPGEKGLNGKDGFDGKDGLGFDDLVVLPDGERSVTFRFARGAQVKDFTVTFPVDIYRGVYTEGKAYDRGDGVTWGGSEWHCNEATTTKPGEGSKAWTLKVKRGRDGKDGRDGRDLAPVVKVS